MKAVRLPELSLPAGDPLQGAGVKADVLVFEKGSSFPLGANPDCI